MRKKLSPAEERILRWMTIAFDAVVIVLGILTMIYVAYLLYDMFLVFIQGPDIENVLHDFLLAVILLEIFELLVLYLREHHVSMRRVAELGVVAIVRKLVITANYNQVGWETLMALAALILALGWVYIQERKRTTQHEEFLLEHGCGSGSLDEG
ncbi:phosphate-starvation-inducible PsiE family protein [Thermococcus sp.]|uniref:phosphate-starvation-inducible PsiE family protein n=1 Tax=Thermococcus sp. TaxID=35749 RepID=UPI00262E47F8|nr:phosphate-starvation-inducible PsiE family protein [Thermococcus sp.]